MKKTNKYIVLSVAVIFLFAVLWFIRVSIFHHHPVYINIVGDDPFHPVFLLDKPYLAKPIGDKIYLKSFLLERDLRYSSDKDVILWKITTQSPLQHRVNKIRYGEVPDGFRPTLVKTAKDLELGEHYDVIVKTASGGLGHIAFSIVEEEGTAKIIIQEE